MPHRNRILTPAAAAALLALAACSGQPSAAQPSSSPTSVTTSATSPTPTRTTSATPTPTPTPTPTATLEPLTISFVGDINFEGAIAPRLAADPATVWGPAIDSLGDADLTIGNLETSISEGGSPEAKAYTFQAPPSAFDALEAAGFDAVSMANNHGVDFGAAGLAQTLAAIPGTSVAVAGIGADAAEAYAPVWLEAKGRTVALLAALDLHDETWYRWGATDTSAGVARFDDRFVESVRTAAQTADITIAYLHWTPENQPCPTVAPDIADELIAAGADIVIGAHAHMLQGAGWKDGAFVAYGVGNYLWYFQRNEQTTRTGIFTVTLDAANDPVSYAYDPARIQTPGGDPVPMTGDAAATARAQLDDLRSCTDLAAGPPG